MLAIGLMSGTSLDGVDAALVEIQGHGFETKVELKAFETYPIEETLKDEIKRALRNDEPLLDLLTSLNFKLGKLFSKAVGEIMKTGGVHGEEIAFVASHGQTLYHIPKDRDGLIRSTLQLGEPAVIAYDHGITVISNFRTMDIAAGGEGAPLVPLTELILYGGKNESMALQNVGGIGNVTFIPKSREEHEVFAFDTGPGNMVIDEAMKILYGLSYDDGGKVALSGEVNEALLEELLGHPFILKDRPKSTGREDFGETYTLQVLKDHPLIKNEDFIATLTMFTAKTMAIAYERFIMKDHPLDKVVLGGGGAHNKALISYLQGLLPEVKILTQEDFGLSSDAKEAIAFAILGNETLHGSHGNLKGATGAKESVILGNITPNPHVKLEKGEQLWPQNGQ